MKHNETFTRILAWIGTIAVWLPIAAMLITSGFALIRLGIFRMDYLIPAEVFPLPLLGGLILYWASLRARSRRPVIGWGLLATVLMLVGSQVLAVVTGLASGDNEPEGVKWFLVVGMLILFDLSFVWLGIFGIKLLVDLYSKEREQLPAAE